jgi:hypothetical protein
MLDCLFIAFSKVYVDYLAFSKVFVDYFVNVC